MNDHMIRRAAELVVSTQFATPQMLVRKLHIGFSRSAELMAELEARGIIGPHQGNRSRDVLVDSVADLPWNDTSDDEAVPYNPDQAWECRGEE